MSGRVKMLTNVKAGGMKCVETICIENKAGVWGQSSQPPEANGGLGLSPRRCGDLTAFFQKIRNFERN